MVSYTHFVTLVQYFFMFFFLFSHCLGNVDMKINPHEEIIHREILAFTPTTSLASSSSSNMFNVDSFGAKADGTDDYKAFHKTWMAACSSKLDSLVLIPKNKIYHLNPITFSGPCTSNIVFKIVGTIKASPNRTAYGSDRLHWINFVNIDNLRVKGGGVVDGNGKTWWIHSCKLNPNLPCTDAPTALTFTGCKNLIVGNLWLKNAQKMHVSFQNCMNVKALNLLVTAPANSPNTDGIHVTNTQNIRILDCDIRTGDDCISIVSGSKNVEATDITCGPGHGISIGSLGAGKSEATVSAVRVNRARISGATNGLRIKTWQGGSGYAKDIIFQNIVMNNVTNPIIVDQNYCDQTKPCLQQVSAVQVSNIVYKNIRGSSASKAAINFNCSKTFPCEGIVLQDVHIVSEEEGSLAKASCVNVRLTSAVNVFPSC